MTARHVGTWLAVTIGLLMTTVLAGCGDGADRSPHWPSGYVVGGCSCWTTGIRPPDGQNSGCDSRRVTATPCSDQQFVQTCRGDSWMMVCG